MNFKNRLIFILFFSGFSTNAYELRVIQSPGYSRPWVLLAADGSDFTTFQEARIHFHGWTQVRETGSPYHPHYDFHWKDPSTLPDVQELKKFVEAYGMQREVEKNPSVLMVIPISRGRCDDYVQLRDIAMFDRAVENVLFEVGINLETFRFTRLSAHSGGGETLSHLLEKTAQSRFLSSSVKVSIYDGIYSAEAKNRILSWLQGTRSENRVELRLFSLPGQIPAKYGKILFDAFPQSTETETLSMDGYSLTRMKKFLLNGPVFTMVQEVAPYRLNHWSLVEFFWLE